VTLPSAGPEPLKALTALLWLAAALLAAAAALSQPPRLLLLLLLGLLPGLAWIGLALAFAARHEWRPQPMPGSAGPPVSVLIPCRNEAQRLPATLAAVLALRWQQLEVLVIDDASDDGSAALLEAWAEREPRLRLLRLERHGGKAAALNAGVRLARHPWLLCLDADSRPAPEALAWLMATCRREPRLAAVTGNLRVANLGSLLGRLQAGEFALIMGVIKRAQSQLGYLFCASGAVVLLRRRALQAVGGWDPSQLTEDIDLTWRLQRAGWRVGFAPRALVWTAMPDRLAPLWRQRLRWARGGLQVLLANRDLLLRPGPWPLPALALEALLGQLTSLAAALAGVAGAVAAPWLLLPLLPLVPLAALLGLLPAAIGLLLDRRHERSATRQALWLIWQPLLLGPLVGLAGLAGLAAWAWVARHRAQR
jgi:biofilm PGA synthesis N-glycosyltransferase PgaC